MEGRWEFSFVQPLVRHLSEDCWMCGRLTFYDRPHADWCSAEGDGRYMTANEYRWPKGGDADRDES